jgi:hypothetical protein
MNYKHKYYKYKSKYINSLGNQSKAPKLNQTGGVFATESDLIDFFVTESLKPLVNQTPEIQRPELPKISQI